MRKSFVFFFFLIISINIFADPFLSSPKIKLNSNDERVIDIKIENAYLMDKDIVLNEYKSDLPIDKEKIIYTLIENFDSYQVLKIVLSDKYEEDYFSFQLKIKDDFQKDIFIFLPSKIRNSSAEMSISESVPRKLDSPLSTNIKEISEEVEITDELRIIEASEITTVWSMAEKIKSKSDDLSIYQIMWSIYLGIKDAFINDNINLIRKDIDINIPMNSEIRDISYQYAKDSILEMNEIYSSRFSLASKSLLVLTAPSVEDNQKLTAETPNSKIENISIDDSLSPKELIEMNTRDLSVKVENQTAESFLEDVNDSKSISKGNNIRIVDILFISVISLVSGIFLALIFINLKNIRKSRNKIDYDFEEVREDDSEKSMPSGLSVENNESQQQLDLAVMYIEMEELEKAKNILNELIQNSDEEAIVDQASGLISKIK